MKKLDLSFIHIDMHRHNHTFYAHRLTPSYLQVVFMKRMLKLSSLYSYSDFAFVIDTVDISEECAVQFKS